MQNDILFDNIYIGHSVEDALKIQKATFDVKVAIEKAEEELLKPKEEEKPADEADAGDFKADPVKFIRTKLDVFWTLAKVDPVKAIKSFPETAGAIIGIVLTTIAFLAVGLGLGGAAPSKEQIKGKVAEAKDKAAAAKDKAGEAISTAAETVKDSATKRSTRNKE